MSGDARDCNNIEVRAVIKFWHVYVLGGVLNAENVKKIQLTKTRDVTATGIDIRIG